MSRPGALQRRLLSRLRSARRESWWECTQPFPELDLPEAPCLDSRVPPSGARPAEVQSGQVEASRASLQKLPFDGSHAEAPGQEGQHWAGEQMLSERETCLPLGHLEPMVFHYWKTIENLLVHKGNLLEELLFGLTNLIGISQPRIEWQTQQHSKAKQQAGAKQHEDLPPRSFRCSSSFCWSQDRMSTCRGECCLDLCR